MYHASSAEGDTTYTIPYYIVSVIMRDALGGRFRRSLLGELQEDWMALACQW